MIHVIGNSHVNTFSNEEFLTRNFKNKYFSSFYLGPVIAYNFLEHHYLKLEDYLINNVNKKRDFIHICVGEVDCRVHLPLQADKQLKCDATVIDECVKRLFRVYDDLLKRQYRCIAFSTHPTTTESHDMSYSDRPIYGSPERRNNICKLWNELTKNSCYYRSMPFISFYEYLVDENNKTKMEYFLDYCHINSKKVFQFIIEELKKSSII